MDDDIERIGRNLRILRESHGETQKDLEKVLNCDRTGISQYERGKVGINDDKLGSVSRYYMISKEEMHRIDLPDDIVPDKVDMTEGFTRIDACFPTRSSFKARRNKSFRQAVECHEHIYGSLKEGDYSVVSDILPCLELYNEAYLDFRSSKEAMVNHTALWYLYMLLTRSSAKIISDRPSVFWQRYADGKGKIEKVEIDKMERAAEYLSEESDRISFPEEFDRLHKYFGKLMSARRYAQICVFYMASGFLYNIINYGFDAEHERTVGMEMMYSLYLSENPYAVCFFKPYNHTVANIVNMTHK